MKQWLKDFVHNCVVHPMMPFLPVKVANWLHDKNANWAFGLERYDELALEDKKKPIDKQLAQLTHQEAKEWQWYLDLKHYEANNLENKKPTPFIRELAQALVDDAMDGGPLQQWLIKPLNFS